MAATDTFNGIFTPYASMAGGFAITATDATELPKVTRAIWVGVAGNLSVVMRDGSALTITNVPVGMHHLRVRQVNATNTTATGLIGFV